MPNSRNSAKLPRPRQSLSKGHHRRTQLFSWRGSVATAFVFLFAGRILNRTRRGVGGTQYTSWRWRNRHLRDALFVAGAISLNAQYIC